MMTADAGNLVVTSLLRQEPFPLLSVIVGTTVIFLLSSGVNASSLEITGDGLSPTANTHGQSSFLISMESQGEFQKPTTRQLQLWGTIRLSL